MIQNYTTLNDRLEGVNTEDPEGVVKDLETILIDANTSYVCKEITREEYRQLAEKGLQIATEAGEIEEGTF